MASSKRKFKRKSALSDADPETKSPPHAPLPKRVKMSGEQEQYVEEEEVPARCLFLEMLPPELRNAIYEEVIVLHPRAHLHRSSAKRNLASSSALVRVNKQVRREFLNMATVCAPIIETTVRNFNFCHIVTFLNRLDDKVLQELLPKNGKSATRVLKMQLMFAGNIEMHTGHAAPLLLRWVWRAESETKKGAAIDFQYEVPRERGGDVPSHNLPLLAGDKSLPEAIKIDQAIKSWRSASRRR